MASPHSITHTETNTHQHSMQIIHLYQTNLLLFFWFLNSFKHLREISSKLENN